MVSARLYNTREEMFRTKKQREINGDDYAEVCKANDKK